MSPFWLCGSVMSRIYLDNNATTAMDPRVIEAMLPFMGAPSNPSSVHSFGREARNAVTKSRRHIAQMLGVRPSEIVFIGGATEALNMCIRGRKGSILTSGCEHAACFETCKERARYVECGEHGAVTPEALEEAITGGEGLIALMAANNETGVKTDLEGIAHVAEAHGVPLVVDGVALLGKEDFTIPPGVSAMCFSGHKIHGPRVGFVVLRHSYKVEPLLVGGEQESHRRAGTEDVAGIVGLAKAIELIDFSGIEALRDRLEVGAGGSVNGTGPRVCNTSNLAFEGMEGEAILMNLDLRGIAVSHGSACSSGSLEPSRVLLNMGYSRERAASSIRFSLSRYTTEAEVDEVIKVLSSLRSSSLQGV